MQQVFNSLQQSTPNLLHDTHATNSQQLNLLTDDLDICLGLCCDIDSLNIKHNIQQRLFVTKLDLHMKIPGNSNLQDEVVNTSLLQQVQCCTQYIDTHAAGDINEHCEPVSNILYQPLVGVFNAAIKNTQSNNPVYNLKSVYNVRYAFEDNIPKSSLATSALPMLNSFVGKNSGSFFPLYDPAKVVVCFLNGQIKSPVILGAIAQNSFTKKSHEGKYKLVSKSKISFELNDLDNTTLELCDGAKERILFNKKATDDTRNNSGGSQIVLIAENVISFSSGRELEHSAEYIYLQSAQFYVYTPEQLLLQTKLLNIQLKEALTADANQYSSNLQSMCVSANKCTIKTNSFQQYAQHCNFNTSQLKFKAETISISSATAKFIASGSYMQTSKGKLNLTAGSIVLNADSIVVN